MGRSSVEPADLEVVVFVESMLGFSLGSLIEAIALSDGLPLRSVTGGQIFKCLDLVGGKGCAF